jgi:protein gp37
MTVQHNKRTDSRGIEWTDHTINVFGGCFHRCRWQMPDGTIAQCYAEALAENGVAKAGYPHGFEHHYYRPSNLKSLVAGRDPKLIFMDSMSDLFGHWVDEDQLTAVFQAMGTAPQHAYQSLTKAPGRITKYMHLFPKNLWVGVSSPPDYMMAAQTAVPDFNGTGMKPATPMPHHAKVRMLQRALTALAEVKAATGNITWMSWEPVSWDMAPHIDVDLMPDWVIIGAASNGRAYFQPDPAHIVPLLNLADEAGTAVFYKGNIKPMFQANDLGSDRLNRWREDFPTRYRDGSPIQAVARRQEQCREYGWTLNLNELAEERPLQVSFFDL